MKILHQISISSSSAIQVELADLGVEVKSSGFVAFKIDESDPRWDGIMNWVKHREPGDFVTTKFNHSELQGAEFLELVSDWHHGYPQPEDHFAYRAATYDLSGSCESCGIERKQVRPFHMKAEPKWGRRSIMQLNWVFGEFFVTPEVWDAVFEPIGIDKRHVVNRHGGELETVVQLVVDEVVGIETAGLRTERCGRCGRVKYLPVARGKFPRLESKPTRPLVKTVQWFGSGASAYRAVLVAQSLRSRLLENQVRGASFWPVSP